MSPHEPHSQPQPGRPSRLTLARRGAPQDWPVWRQLTGGDLLGRGAATRSRRHLQITPRTATADAVVKSVCPFCAVGCAQNVYVKHLAADVGEDELLLLADAQTSGGLLVAGEVPGAPVIGELVPAADTTVTVR